MILALQTKFHLLSFGLILATLLLSWFLGLAFGGFKLGRLARTIELSVAREQLAGFLDTFQRRATELGFCSGEVPGQYLQGGSEFMNLSSYTHAKTKKRLDIAMHDSGAAIQVQLTLQYLDPIIGDTGEGAYRDAVLDYVSSQKDAMQVVTNRSFAAFSSLVGGLCAWAALFGLKAVNYQPLLPPMLVIGGTYFVTGIIALIVIATKPRELTGVGLAVAGMIASASATMLAVVLAIAKDA